MSPNWSAEPLKGGVGSHYPKKSYPASLNLLNVRSSANLDSLRRRSIGEDVHVLRPTLMSRMTLDRKSWNTRFWLEEKLGTQMHSISKEDKAGTGNTTRTLTWFRTQRLFNGLKRPSNFTCRIRLKAPSTADGLARLQHNQDSR